MLRVFLLLLSFAFFPTVVLGECEQARQSDDERFTDFSTMPDDLDLSAIDYNELSVAMLERFRSLWCEREYDEGLEAVSDEAVAIRLRAARSATLHGRPDWVIARLKAALEEGHVRGLAGEGDFATLLWAYQAEGRFEDARRLRQEYPDVDMPEVPEIERPSSPAPDNARLVWRVDGEENRQVGEWLTLEGPQLLIVTSTGCSYCRAAAQELLVDEVLASLMRRHAYWLGDVGSRAQSFHRVAHWNEDYPDAPTLLVDDPKEWPIEQFDSTPQFHFVLDGEIIHSLTGWRGGPDALAAIADGFEHLGLIDTSQLPEDVFAYADKPSYTRGCPERAEAWERIRERTPISTREELERHLAAIEDGMDSPLTLLSVEARERFASGIRFREGMVVSFRQGDIKEQLEPHEIHELAKLFGMQFRFAGYLFDVELLSEEERELKDMLDCKA